jgi:hypothetical protein
MPLSRVGLLDTQVHNFVAYSPGGLSVPKVGIFELLTDEFHVCLFYLAPTKMSHFDSDPRVGTPLPAISQGRPYREANY